MTDDDGIRNLYSIIIYDQTVNNSLEREHVFKHWIILRICPSLSLPDLNTMEVSIDMVLEFIANKPDIITIMNLLLLVCAAPNCAQV